MDILLIGGSGNITNSILEKLHKEGHRIFVLTGSTVKSYAYSHVFEQYSFSYDSNSIKEIFESILPDVTIFMGAYDTNFDWQNAREESVRYSAGLLNILMGYSLVKCGRFIYLSSDLVYHQSYPEDITEEEPVTPDDFHSRIIAQGEDLCRSYQRLDGLDIVILRLDHLYGLPSNAQEAREPCADMCIQALKTGKIIADSRKYFSMLFISDAVQFLYQILCAKELSASLYHLSASREISELYLAQRIQKELGEDIVIEERPGRREHRVILSAGKFREEFQGKILWTVNRVVPYMVSHIKNHRSELLGEEVPLRGYLDNMRRSKVMDGVRAALPTMENILCFILFFLLDSWAENSIYLSGLDFDLIYVVLLAIVYGQRQAMLASLFSTAGYCIREMYVRSGFDVAMDYSTYVWAAQLFILGMVVGYLHDKLTIVREESRAERDYLSGQIEDIQDINASNVRIKNLLEEQIVNHSQSVGKIYEITSELDRYAPEEVLYYAAGVVARLLDCEDVAIYSVERASEAVLVSATSSEAHRLGESVRCRELGEVYQALADKKVFINKKLDEKWPMFASGIYEGERLRIIVMVWRVPWERVNLSTANMLKVIGYLIRNAVLRASYAGRQEDGQGIKWQEERAN